MRNLFLPIKNFSPSHKNVFLHKVETCRSIGLCYTSSKEIIFVFNTSSDIKMSKYNIKSDFALILLNMTFDEYFKITRFKNRKSFNRPSLLFVLLVVILLISITTFIRRWCQYCSDGLSVAPPQSVIGAFLSFVYAAYTSVRTSQRIL